MLLEHYIKREGCGYAGFGQRLSPPMNKGDVWNVAHGVRGISTDRAEQVIEASDGEVTFEDLMRPFKSGFVMPSIEPKRRRA